MKQDEDKLSYIDDFQEILQSEVYVDLERLRILARHGIPNQLRSVYVFPPFIYTYIYITYPFHLSGSMEIPVRCTTSG
jgi:hypothetical protein